MPPKLSEFNYPDLAGNCINFAMRHTVGACDFHGNQFFICIKGFLPHETAKYCSLSHKQSIGVLVQNGGNLRLEAELMTNSDNILKGVE